MKLSRFAQYAWFVLAANLGVILAPVWMQISSTCCWPPQISPKNRRFNGVERWK